MSTLREEQAQQWLDTIFPSSSYAIALLAGDASFRRYFRVRENNGHCWVLMDAPPEKENCEPFLRIARHWHAAGVPVPAIKAESTSLGFILLEDFGDITLMKHIGNDSPDAVYRNCIDALLRLQTMTDTPGLPAYDEALLRREMALFTDWLIRQFLMLTPPDDVARSLQHWFDDLVANALSQPTVPVHRDYHSRNLMVPEDRTLGILDFQDAVVGPYTYDLVSLVKDCYVRWPVEKVASWCQYYYQQLPAGLQAGRTFRQFEHDVCLMGMQRHLKAAGIFARLWLRDGKAGYLADIPNTVAYLEEALQQLSAWQPVSEWLTGVVQPRLAARLKEEGLR
jgi:aminoglycoside/choline kinase family phosphotransferase